MVFGGGGREREAVWGWGREDMEGTRGACGREDGEDGTVAGGREGRKYE